MHAQARISSSVRNVETVSRDFEQGPALAHKENCSKLEDACYTSWNCRNRNVVCLMLHIKVCFKIVLLENYISCSVRF
jgi:hypothetical protein